MQMSVILSETGIREDVDSLISESVCVSVLCANQEAAREAREKQGDQGAASEAGSSRHPFHPGPAGVVLWKLSGGALPGD